MALQRGSSDLLSLPTEILSHIIGYLPAYDKLCVRITCKRLHSIVSDPCLVWDCLVWRDCRKSERYLKALRLALKLARQHVKVVAISYQYPFSIVQVSQFLPQVCNCKQLQSLSLTGMPVTLSALNTVLSELSLLHSLTLTTSEQLRSKDILPATARVKQLTHLYLQDFDVVAYFHEEVVEEWKQCCYYPPNLCVFVERPSLNFIRAISSSHHPAFLLIYPTSIQSLVHQFPFLEISLYPSVQAVSCNSRSISSACPDETCVVLAKEKSATFCQAPDTISLLHFGPTLPHLPASIEYLCLAKMFSLSSKDLTHLSKSCPNLVCLNIEQCKKALLVLQGLTDIGSNCSRLTSLNLMAITEVESVTILWEVLSRMKKLRHLAMDEHLCVSDKEHSTNEKHIETICTKTCSLRLHTFEVTVLSHEPGRRPDPVNLELDPFLPVLCLLQDLRILSSGFVDMTRVLPALPNLVSLYIVCEGVLLPTTLDCYSSLEQICLISDEITMEHMKAFLDKLTHLCLDSAEIPFSDPSVYLEVF